MNPYQRYSTIQATTASTGTLVIMLYQGAVRFARAAQDAIAQHDVERAHHALIKAQALITELRSGLDFSAGELARNLDAVYDYLQRRLVEANIRKDPAIAEEVVSLLSELLPAWVHAARTAETGDTSDRLVGSSDRTLRR